MGKDCREQKVWERVTLETRRWWRYIVDDMEIRGEGGKEEEALPAFRSTRSNILGAVERGGRRYTHTCIALNSCFLVFHGAFDVIPPVLHISI